MPNEKINFKDKFALFNEQWQPKVIAEMNDYQFKLTKIQGHFVWHDHKDTDEVFIIFKGAMRMDYRDKKVILNEGEMCVVPKGVEHKPYAEHECHIMVIEPRGVVNTGDAGDEMRAENNVWI